jgi:hypothetical protein
MRNVLDRDLIEAEECLARAFWKPAMILCGSILEAALYEFLRRNSKWTMDEPARKGIPKCRGTPRDITKDDWGNQWSLEDLIDFVCDNEILGKDAEHWRGSLHLLRKHRNLVHPTAELRKEANKNVSEAAAQQCYGTLRGFLEVLSKCETPK